MNAEIIAHPNAFVSRIKDGVNDGCPLSMNELNLKYKVITSKKPVKVTKNLTFLGEIPLTNDFEMRKQFGYYTENSESFPDYINDDSALVFETEKGISIITGCSHSGICNIVEYAKNLFKKPVIGIIGGFHLKDVDVRLEKTIAYLKAEKIRDLMPCHCTSFPVRCSINSTIPVKDVGVGTKIEW